METAEGSHQAKSGDGARSAPTAQRIVVIVIAVALLAAVAALVFFAGG